MWSGTTILSHVDATSFQLLHNHVYKDAEHVFVSTQALEVPGADPATFEKLGKLSGHNSVFEPDKHGVSFPGHDAVLFRDVRNFYVFEPDYGEMYTLELKGEQIVISKPVWLSTKGSSRPIHGATVSAELNDNALSKPVITMLPAGKSNAPPQGEKEKLKRNLRLFLAARDRMVK